MSGEVIPFRGHAELRRAAHYRQPTVEESLEAHMTRIAGLLEELEGLTRTARHVPAPVLKKARVIMDRARQLVATAAPGDATEGSEPQPEIDGEMLERMYRDTNPHKLKPNT